MTTSLMTAVNVDPQPTHHADVTCLTDADSTRIAVALAATHAESTRIAYAQA